MCAPCAGCGRCGQAPYYNPSHFQRHKYLLSVDGTVAAYRLPLLLAGNSVVLKQVRHGDGPVCSLVQVPPPPPPPPGARVRAYGYPSTLLISVRLA